MDDLTFSPALLLHREVCGKNQSIDEIDRALAQHYGFTDEEYDFISNYDIKYRVGGAGDENGDEDE